MPGELAAVAQTDRRAVALLFLIALAVCALVTKPRVVSWNDGSRIATVDALTAGGTFRIDGSPFAVGLGDKIRFHGATYSDKPPLLAMLAAAVALVVAPAGISLRHTPGTAIYLVTLFTVGVWFAVGCCYAYAFAQYLGLSRSVAIAVAALTGVGTLALPYATVLTNHVPCGACALAGCFYAVRARDGARWAAPLAGLFFALAYAFDAAGILLALAGAILLWGAPLRTWLLVLAAGLPVVALECAYNLRVSGSVMPTAFTVAVWKDPSLPFYSPSQQAFPVFSPADYLRFAVSLLVGTKGLFSFTPLMLVAGYGLLVMVRAPGLARRLAIAIAATTIVYFAAIVLLQNDTGARNFGERRYVDLFFLLCVAVGPALASVRGPLARLAVYIASALSVAIAALGTVAPFGGAPGESGYAFGLAEFAALYRRAPVSAALDVVMLVVLLVVVLRIVERAFRAPRASAVAPRRA
jgi:hypothetical protein